MPLVKNVADEAPDLRECRDADIPVTASSAKILLVRAKS
jgi:hypothetical protein